MKVRILKQPTGFLHGITLSAYRVGGVYDIPSDLASYLVVEGFARSEMREREDPGREPATERRKHSIKR